MGQIMHEFREQREGESDEEYAERYLYWRKLRSLRFDTGGLSAQNREDRAMRRDMDTYRELRRQGYQPPSVGGAYKRARDAQSEADVCVHKAKAADEQTLKELAS